MPRPDPNTIDHLLDGVRTHADSYLAELDGRSVAATADDKDLLSILGGPLPDDPTDPVDVVDLLASVQGSGMTASTSARFFGFVVGGVLPAAMAVDMLAPVWDQNAGLFVIGPAAAVVEDIARTWLIDLFGLPAHASVGFVTGGQMASTTALAIARHHVLSAAGWDVERDGLAASPPITVVAGVERHSTIDRGMRFVGLGSRPTLVDVDANGAMIPQHLSQVLADTGGPLIVCAQAGNVNTGALDPVGDIVEIAHQRGAWVHVDGAFGLWAACLDRYSDAVSGLSTADSWSVDAHKWLNVPYDSGLVFSAHPSSHVAAVGVARGSASYLIFDERTRDAVDWSPEFSRRARGFAIWAALRSLGRSGVKEMVDRACECAMLFASLLGAAPGVEVRNEVVLNQVLVAFDGVDLDELLGAVVAEGTAWMSGTTWRGERLMRISVSNWQTDREDVESSVEAVLACYRTLLG